MFNFEDIFFLFLPKAEKHLASQLRLFHINRSKIIEWGETAKLDKKKTAKNVYFGVTGITTVLAYNVANTINLV